MSRTYIHNTAQWTFFAWASFVSAVLMMAVGIHYLPVDPWIKGYVAMGAFFMMGSTFTLSKTIRDNHELETMAAPPAEVTELRRAA